MCQRLTLTWDVLKYERLGNDVKVHYTININMRCIEIRSYGKKKVQSYGLTLTWDVLKYAIETLLSTLLIWLTLTWDVLKWN